MKKVEAMLMFKNSLSKTEKSIVEILVSSEGQVVPRSRLLGILNGRSPRTLDTYVKQIRSKMRASGLDDKTLVTQIGIGYRFVPTLVTREPNT